MNQFPFSLTQFTILQTIVRAGSFSAAAEILYISQPAVTLQMKNLEKQVNNKLFLKRGKQIELTEGGYLLLRYSQKILLLCEETCQALQDLKNSQIGYLTLGASQTTGTYLMPLLIQSFRKEYNHVKIQLHVDSTRHICWNVAKGIIDLALVSGEVPFDLRSYLHLTDYADEELALIASPEHFLFQTGKKASITKNELYNLKFIFLEPHSTVRKVLECTLEFHMISIQKLKIEMELSSIEAIKSAVESNLGVAFLSSVAIQKELELKTLVQLNIEDVTLSRTISIVMNARRYRSKATKLFRSKTLASFYHPCLKLNTKAIL